MSEWLCRTNDVCGIISCFYKRSKYFHSLTPFSLTTLLNFKIFGSGCSYRMYKCCDYWVYVFTTRNRHTVPTCRQETVFLQNSQKCFTHTRRSQWPRYLLYSFLTQAVPSTCMYVVATGFTCVQRITITRYRSVVKKPWFGEVFSFVCSPLPFYRFVMITLLTFCSACLGWVCECACSWVYVLRACLDRERSIRIQRYTKKNTFFTLFSP